jgi:hypothetical protein
MLIRIAPRERTRIRHALQRPGGFDPRHVHACCHVGNEPAVQLDIHEIRRKDQREKRREHGARLRHRQESAARMDGRGDRERSAPDVHAVIVPEQERRRDQHGERGQACRSRRPRVPQEEARCRDVEQDLRISVRPRERHDFGHRRPHAEEP